MKPALLWPLATLLTALGAAACSSDKPQVILLASGSWNENPSTVAETGYQVGADVGWPERPMSCFALPPNLTININDASVTPMVYGDCRLDVLVYSGAFQQDVPITVKLQDGDEVLAEAQIEGLFPGAHAQLIAPSGGQVKVGDPVVIGMPFTGLPPWLVAADFYWLDMPAGAPPFHTFVAGTLSADGSTFQTTAPNVTGRAAVVVDTSFTPPDVVASACTGFDACAVEANHNTIGPVFVEVVP